MTTTNRTPAAAAGTFLLGGDTPVTRLGYGAMQLTGPNAFGPPADEAAALAVLRRAVELGVNHVDTSDYYGPYLVNELIRRALHPYPEGLVLVTKVGARRGPDGSWLPADSPDELRRAVHENLERLGVDRLDVVNLRLGSLGGPEPGSLAERFAPLVELREQGLIRHLGLSNVDAAQLDEAVGMAPVVCVQNMFSMAEQGDLAMLRDCAEREIAYVPFFPLGGFRPLDGTAQGAALARVAARHGVGWARVALAWLLAVSPAVLAIPGTSSVAHLEENVAAAALQLTEPDLAELG